MEKADLSALIYRFLEGNSDKWEFDDFISVRRSDHLEDYRIKILEIAEANPPLHPGFFVSPIGIRLLRFVADDLSNH